MTYTAPSEDLLLRLEKVSLRFTVTVNRPRTWRGIFTGLPRGRRATREVAALDGVDLTIRRGDRIGVIGRNGSGKTTLCRVISGIFEPTEGRLIHENAKYGGVRAAFGSEVGFEPDLTGRANVRLLRSVLLPEVFFTAADYDEIRDFSGLGEFFDVPVRRYSAGMQRRLALTLLTCRPAGILVMDEATGGADAAFQARFQGRLLGLLTRCGASVLVSHDTRQLLEFCNRVLVYEGGKIVFDGPPKEAIGYYLSRFSSG